MNARPSVDKRAGPDVGFMLPSILYDGAAPHDNLTVGVFTTAPDDHLSRGGLDPAAPDDNVAVAPSGNLAPDQPIHRQPGERVRKAQEIQHTPLRVVGALEQP